MATQTRTKTATRRRLTKLDNDSNDDGLLDREDIDVDTDDMEAVASAGEKGDGGEEQGGGGVDDGVGGADVGEHAAVDLLSSAVRSLGQRTCLAIAKHSGAFLQAR